MIKILIFFLLASSLSILANADQDLYYEVKGTGPTIVFSHGGFGDRRMWDAQFDEFSKKYRVIRYDHRGFGKSPAPASEYSPVQDLVNLLDQLKIDRAHIVGNSMGGSLGIDFTLQHPSRVASLTVVASGPNGVPVPKEDQEKMNAVFKTAADQGFDAAAEMWINSPMVAVTSHLSSTEALLKKMIHENSSIFRMRYWPIEKMDPPAVKRLGEIKVPTLIILGEKDTKLVNEIGNLAASGIQGARKEIIPNADHLPQMVDPKKFNEILSKFLRTFKD
ncbi:MAG TPA: alpha/beta hydrolase [Acidobacteriota bacterium]|nr:alpha/beta hydrolase [Acidobacteriota bacterium]